MQLGYILSIICLKLFFVLQFAFLMVMYIFFSFSPSLEAEILKVWMQLFCGL